MYQSYYTDFDGHIIMSEKDQISDWLHVTNPTVDEIEYLSKKFNFPKDYISSVKDPDELARQEKLGMDPAKDPNLIVFNYPTKITNKSGYDEYLTTPISMILTKDTLITAVEDTPVFLKNIMNNQSGYPVNTKKKEQFVLEVAWQISSLYVFYLKEIILKTESMERQLTKSTENEQLFALMSLQKSLIYFSSSIHASHLIFNDLKEIDSFTERTENRNLLHDVIVESRQAEVMIEETSKLLDQISDIFPSIISNNLNNIMKILTSITIVLTIPTILGGFWGMNVNLPIDNGPNAFWAIMFLILFISIITTWILKKNNYF
ncbi:magnesium transporter CorA family protein [Carnobacterium funditum]|uniref:magnesium transporter CorA family protein n=1 Tax=Carnobacterium funditum TaxID=2752 RepID=UPI0006892C49|nr:magnesium transporter CorA family protein [Carnobacterium funditum]